MQTGMVIYTAMRIKVVVNGANGKMGKTTVAFIENEPDLELVGQSDVGNSLADVIKSTRPDVVVDFTHVSCATANARLILENNCHAVMGTTGILESEFAPLHSLAVSRNKGIIVCPNFAIGAILMMRAAEMIASHMPNVEIIELHHDRKGDSPSGTALKTADMIATKNPAINSDRHPETELVTGARGGRYREIPIHSVRLPGFVAHQQVIFGGPGQVLTLTHDAMSRESFMPGVMVAIRHVITQTGLIYGLESII